MKKINFKKRVISVVATILLVANFSTSISATAGTYMYKGSFDFYTGSNGKYVLSGANNGVFRTFQKNNNSAYISITDTPTNGNSTYTASLRRRIYYTSQSDWSDYVVGSFGTWTHRRDTTHYSYVKPDVTGSKYFLAFSGSGINQHYAGNYELYQNYN